MRRMKVTDRIAAEAARLFEQGNAASVREAVDLAAERLGLDDGPRPSNGRVRQHLQARSMQSLGESGYRAHVAAIYEIAEQLMTLLAEGLDDAEPMLVGRAARGLVDGDGRLHVRLYTTLPVDVIAALLVEHGYDEPSFETARTRYGRLSRIVLLEADQQIVITRCLLPMRAEHRTCLFTGRPIETASIEQVRRRRTELTS